MGPPMYQQNQKYVSTNTREHAYVRQAMLVHGMGKADTRSSSSSSSSSSSIMADSVGKLAKQRPASARTTYAGSYKEGSEIDRNAVGMHHRPKSSTASSPSLASVYGIKGVAAPSSVSTSSATRIAAEKKGAATTRGSSTKESKEEDIIIVENGNFPGAGANVAIRSLRSKESSPERMNLDRRALTSCCILKGEEQLRLLNYQHNSISKIQHLNNLNNLVFLDMYNNSLTEISGLEHLPNIRVLMLGRNNIRMISGLASLRKLDVLDIHSNHISRIEGLMGLSSLRILNLAGNLISSMEDLSMLGMLTELNLRRNALDSFDIGSEGDGSRRKNPFPTKLQRVFLSYNKLSKTDHLHFLSQLPMLRELALDGNPFNAVGREYRMDVIRICQRLNRLDTTMVSEEERQAALSSTARGTATIRHADFQPMVTASTRCCDVLHDYDDDEGNDRGVDDDDCDDDEGEGDAERSGASHSSGADDSDLATSDTTASPPPELSGDDSLEGDNLVAFQQDEHSKFRSKEESTSSNTRSTFCSSRGVNGSRHLEGRRLSDRAGSALSESADGVRTVRITSEDSLKALEKMSCSAPFRLELVGLDGLALRRKLLKIKTFSVTTLVLADTGLSNLIELLPLSDFPELCSLCVRPHGNPVVDDELFRPFLCACLPELSTLNEVAVTTEERNISQQLMRPFFNLIQESLSSEPIHPSLMSGGISATDLLEHMKPVAMSARTNADSKMSAQLVASGHHVNSVCRHLNAKMFTVDSRAHKRSMRHLQRTGSPAHERGFLPGRATGARISVVDTRDRVDVRAGVDIEECGDAAMRILNSALRVAEASAAFDGIWAHALQALVKEALEEAEELDCNGISYR